MYKMYDKKTKIRHKIRDYVYWLLSIIQITETFALALRSKPIAYWPLNVKKGNLAKGN